MLFAIFEQIFIALASEQKLNSGQNPVLKLQQKGFFYIILGHTNSQFLQSSELCLNHHHLLGRPRVGKMKTPLCTGCATMLQEEKNTTAG